MHGNAGETGNVTAASINEVYDRMGPTMRTRVPLVQAAPRPHCIHTATREASAKHKTKLRHGADREVNAEVANMQEIPAIAGGWILRDTCAPKVAGAQKARGTYLVVLVIRYRHVIRPCAHDVTAIREKQALAWTHAVSTTGRSNGVWACIAQDQMLRVVWLHLLEQADRPNTQFHHKPPGGVLALPYRIVVLIYKVGLVKRVHVGDAIAITPACTVSRAPSGKGAGGKQSVARSVARAQQWRQDCEYTSSRT
jgi:hypothetical protein